jgi:4-amino-4-deoxy-L-arabinose transferase-like glycosyltransferase
LTPAEILTESRATSTASKPDSLLKASFFWFGVAIVAIIILYSRLLHLSFDGDYQGWASASCMTMAHSFNQLGALHTHFVPIQNNLPLGSDPDVYLHWPPLYPFLLSLVTRVLGDHESSGRLFALVITLATTFVVVAIARRYYGAPAAFLSGFFFLTFRTTFEGGRAILHQPLALFFGCVTVLFFLIAVDVRLAKERRRLFAALSVAATVCSMLTAWDPAFIPLGLLLASIYLRRREAIRLASFNVLAGIATFIAVQANYILAYPQLFKNQFATIAYRAGLNFNAASSTRLHTIVDQVHYLGGTLTFLGTLSHIFLWIFTGIGSFSLLAGFLFFANWLKSNRRENSTAVYIIGGLCLPWLLFFVIMRNYVAIHPFPLILATPFLAIASGFVLNRAWEVLSAANSYRYYLRVMILVLPLITMYPILTNIRDAKVPDERLQFQDLSALIQRNTPADAVTLSPEESAVPIYYSDRHIVRGIATPALLRQAIPQARADFSNGPLFFALHDTDRTDFADMLPQFTLVAHQGNSTLYRIP